MEVSASHAHLVSFLLFDFGNAAFAVQEVMCFAEGVGTILEQILV
jgi:hypothetical protein